MLLVFGNGASDYHGDGAVVIKLILLMLLVIAE